MTEPIVNELRYYFITILKIPATNVEIIGPSLNYTNKKNTQIKCKFNKFWNQSPDMYFLILFPIGCEKGMKTMAKRRKSKQKKQYETKMRKNNDFNAILWYCDMVMDMFFKHERLAH